jgi:PAS domain S-box-containing protein
MMKQATLLCLLRRSSGTNMFWLALLVFGLSMPGATQAVTTLDIWRSEVSATRKLAENAPQVAYKEAKRLQGTLPADATFEDQVRVLNLLSRIEVYLALIDQAEKHIQLALDMAVQHKDRVGQAEAQLNIVINAINRGKINTSIEATTRSVELLDGINRPDLHAEALLRMSMMYRQLGKFDDSVTMAMQAMEIARRTNESLALTYAHQGLAISFDQSGRYKEALEQYQKMREEARAARSKFLEAYAVLGQAGVTHSLGNIVGSDRLMRETIAMFRSLQMPFSINLGLYGYAYSLGQQGRHAEARPLLDEMVSTYAKYPNPIGLWYALTSRSKNFQELGNAAEAQADAEKAYVLAKKIGKPLYLSESARGLAAIAAAAGDHRKAYQLSVEANKTTDKATRENISSRTVELVERYESVSKQRQIDELTRRNERQAFQQHWLWTVLGAIVILLAGTAYFLLKVRRSNRLLEALNTRVRRSQNKMQATLDALPDLLFILGLDGRYHEYHSTHDELLAVSPESLLGKTVYDILPSVAAEICMSALREAHEKGLSTGMQFQLQLGHKEFWFELSVSRKKVCPGEEPLFIVISRDITEQKAHILELQRWHDIFEYAEWGIVVSSADGKALGLMNPAFARMHGYTVDELTGKPIVEVFAPKSRESLPGQILLAHLKGHHSFESFHLRKDGTIFPVFIDVTTVKDTSGQVLHRIVNVLDITERKSSEVALRESEEKYRTLIQKIQAAVVVHGADTKILISNPEAQQILGLSEEQLLGKAAIDPAWHFFLEDRRSAPFDEYPVNQVLATRKALTNYVLGIHRSNHQNDVWVLVNADPVFGKDGAISQVIVTFIDITQRKHAEEALVEREREFRTLAENIPDNIIRYDTQARKIYMNSAVVRQMGIKPEMLIGKTPEETPLESRISAFDNLSKKIRLVLDSGEPQELEVSVAHAEEGPQIHNILLVAERDEHGRIVGALAIGRNITAQKIAENALKEREQRYREIFDNASDGMYLLEVTDDGRFRNIDINPALVKSTGMSRESMIGKFVDETVSAEMGRLIVEKYRRCVAAGTTINESIELDLPAGKNFYYSTIIPIYYDGRVSRLIGLSRDITELKVVENDLEASRTQLRGLMAQREEVREEERKYIAREVHDELGQILTGLQLNISVLAHKFAADSSALREHLKETLILADKALGVARNVATALRPAALDMGIVSALEWVAGRFSTNTGIQCGVYAEDTEIQLDENHAIALFRIVQEALTNIVRHANASKVHIIFCRVGDDYFLKVRDNGSGFDQKTKRPDSFGLVGMQERALLLGGEVVINSKLGEGTEVEVHIPANNIVRAT